MESFGFAMLGLNGNLTNPSTYNKTTMTNNSLTSCSSVKVVGHKRKRSSLPDVFSATAGHAKNFLKRFKRSFGSPSDIVSFTPTKRSPHAQPPFKNHRKDDTRLSSSNDETSIVEKVGLDTVVDVLDKDSCVANRSPKLVCFDSVSSSKWSQLEISLSPKKHNSGIRKLEGDLHCDRSASRMLCWDQATRDDSIKKVMPAWPLSVGVNDQMLGKRRMSYLNGSKTSTASELEFCMTMNVDGTTNTIPLKPKIEKSHYLHHLETRSSLTLERYETSSGKYKNLFTNSTNTLTKKEVYTEAAAFKAVLDDSGFFSENINTSLETTVKPAIRYCATKVAAQGNGKRLVDFESLNSKVTESCNLNSALKSVQTKSAKSLLFLPFPHVPFKVRASDPLNVRFEVTYTESSMIPSVKSAGKVFEAKLQEITRDEAGREGFRDSPSNFSCSIQVETSHPAEKFEEIKNALRVVCDSYNLGVQSFSPENSIKLSKDGHGIQAEQVYTTTSSRSNPPDSSDQPIRGVADLQEMFRSQHNLQTSSADQGSVPSGAGNKESFNTELVVASGSQDSWPVDAMSVMMDEKGTDNHSTDLSEVGMSVRRSHRKFKPAGLWKERNAYATRLIRPNSTYPDEIRQIEDQTYLDKTFFVDQFIQDITGIPVVVLERLSSKEIQKLSHHSRT